MKPLRTNPPAAMAAANQAVARVVPVLRFGPAREVETVAWDARGAAPVDRRPQAGEQRDTAGGSCEKVGVRSWESLQQRVSFSPEMRLLLTSHLFHAEARGLCDAKVWSCARQTPRMHVWQTGRRTCVSTVESCVGGSSADRDAPTGRATRSPDRRIELHLGLSR